MRARDADGDPLLRVAVDARSLNVGHLRGLGKYALEIVRTIGDRVDWRFYANRPDLPFHLPELAGKAQLVDVPGTRFTAWEQLYLPLQARRARCDLLHCVANVLPFWQPCPTVVTLHDTMAWKLEEGSGGFHVDRLIPAALSRAAAVVTISEHSRRDIVQLWPGLESKLELIPHGIGQEFLSLAPAPLSHSLLAAGVREPYLLYIGGSLPRKRLDWALRVFDTLHDGGLQLVVCGLQTAQQEEFRDRISPRLREAVLFASFVDGSDMPRLLQNAAALLYPTLYEGFGFPAIEAQAVGTPALFSPVSSLKELAGPGALLLDPDDLEGWVATVRRLLDARRSGASPNPEARAFARRFSWEESAARHLDVYRRVSRYRALSRSAPEGRRA